MSGWAQREAERQEYEAKSMDDEMAALRERVAELEAIIAGRTTPPTVAEIVAHHLRGGDWIVSVLRDDVPYFQRLEHWPETSVEGVCGPLRRGMRYDVRWVPVLGGRPCAWPAAATPEVPRE